MVHEVDPRELFTRYEGNPIIKPAAFPSMVNAAFNPAAVSFEGQTLLLIRVEDRTGLSRLVVATSDDGFTDWKVDLTPGHDAGPRLLRGAMGRRGPSDHRDEDGGYLIVYTGYSPGGPLVCLATTTDFRTFERRGVDPVTRGQGRGASPAEVRRSLGIDPPPGVARGAEHGAHIWLSWSPDLRHWGDSQILLPARRARGGMPTRSGSGHRRSSPTKGGCSAITAFVSRSPARSTGSDWRSSTATTPPL